MRRNATVYRDALEDSTTHYQAQSRPDLVCGVDLQTPSNGLINAMTGNALQLFQLGTCS
jgi:hypothetical protein